VGLAERAIQVLCFAADARASLSAVQLGAIITTNSGD